MRAAASCDSPNIDRIPRPEADSDLVCQPGAKWMDINDNLKEKGRWLYFPAPGDGNLITVTLGIPLFFPVSLRFFWPRTITISARQLDPAPGATIGGMLSTGCSGSVFVLPILHPCV